MNLLKNKVAVVTGAARGIGRTIATEFAAEGADVAFVVLRDDERASSLAQEIASYGVRTKSYVANVAEFDTVKNIVEKIKSDFGRIDVLVNNAGITRDTLMLRMSESQWDEVIAVNLKSAFNFAYAVAPIMLTQRSGCIINMTSVVGLHGNAGQANYSASKAGLIALAKSMAQEFGSRGVRVNAIAPGFINTDMTSKLKESVREEWCKKIPLRRGGTPHDVAQTAIFLASEMASYITGQVITVDGGMSM